jgi:hypothetical protein
MRHIAITFLLLLPALKAGAQALALPAQITNASGAVTSGFVTGADKDGIFISTSPDGGNSIKMPVSGIKDYNIEEPKGWSAALALYQSGDYAQAEAQLGAFAQQLEKRDGYGSQAKLFYWQCLKKQGKYAELSKSMDAQLANPVSFGPAWTEDFQDLQGWAVVGKRDWQMLAQYLKDYQDKDKQGSLPQPPFKTANRNRLASLSFLRAILNEQTEKKDLALVDYHGALSLDFGSDHATASGATLAALRLVNEKMQSAPAENRLKKMGHALAVTYRDLYGKGQVPPEFTKLLEAPPADQPPVEPAK